MAERRAQKRFPVAIPVMVGGVDAQGINFVESTHANDVSRRGLSLLTSRDLPVRGTVTVIIPNRGPRRTDPDATHFFTCATVVGSHKEKGVNRIALRFVGATLPMYSRENL